MLIQSFRIISYNLMHAMLVYDARLFNPYGNFSTNILLIFSSEWALGPFWNGFFSIYLKILLKRNSPYKVYYLSFFIVFTHKYFFANQFQCKKLKNICTANWTMYTDKWKKFTQTNFIYIPSSIYLLLDWKLSVILMITCWCSQW